MKRAVAVLALVTGCTTSDPSSPNKAATALLTDAEWAIVQQRCAPCHAPAAGGAPGGIVLQSPADLQPWQLPEWVVALQDGRAPFFFRLADSEREALLAPARRAGMSIPAPVRPQHVRWRMSDAWASMALGTSASAPGVGFGFTIEDGRRDGWDGTSEWTITRVDGQPALSLTRLYKPAGQQPSSYFAPSLEAHAELADATVTGSMMHGRWTSVGLGCVDLVGPTRSHREYVRFTLDRDSATLRSAPMIEEAWPFYQDPDHALIGSELAVRFPFALPHTEHLRFEFSCTQVPDGTAYRARAWRADGSMLCDLAALDPRGPRAGGFFFHKYALSGNHAAVWWDVVVDGTTAFGPSPRRPPQEVAPCTDAPHATAAFPSRTIAPSAICIGPSCPTGSSGSSASTTRAANNSELHPHRNGGR